VRASTTCLIMADHNRYSVDAQAAGRMVLVRSYAERIVVLFDDEVVADHPRQFRRDQIIYDPWHYLPVLMKKPGALRNGAPFKDWDLPPALTQVRAKLKQHPDGDRQFVKVLGAVLDHGLAAVESACAEALEAGIASGDVILTVLARRRQPTPPPSVTTPEALRLKIEPVADCGRYDRIRKIALGFVIGDLLHMVVGVCGTVFRDPLSEGFRHFVTSMPSRQSGRSCHA
jgi:hypothetical protein